MENEQKLNRVMLIKCFIKHETLTMEDTLKEENIGVRTGEAHLKYLLEELTEAGLLQRLNGVEPVSYTITLKGIEEGARLVKAGICK